MLEEKNKHYHIINYGCQMNQSDSEHYAGQLESFDYQLAGHYSGADLVLINTCCIRESAEKKIHGKIGELKHWKEARPGSVMVLAGCMAQKDGEKLLAKYRQLDLVLGTFHISRFAQILAEFSESRQRRVVVDEELSDDEFAGSVSRRSGFSAWTPIMYGCNNFCTYCIVPYVRGRERSRSEEEIVAEVRRAVAAGYKEFTLLGQNVNSYGLDWGKKGSFAKLLQSVDEIKGVERVRFMTSHPRDMGEDVVAAVAEGKHLCEHFHLPVQAGSDRIIAAMNRGYSREEYLKLVALVRSYLPAASITTDIIVGFPGETDEDFAATCSLVEEVGYDAAYTFLYSARSGTPAAKMPDQVALAVKKERLKKLMEIQNASGLKRNQALLGSVEEVMLEGASQTDVNMLTGRTRTNKIVVWPRSGGDMPPGALVPVLITAAQTWILKGQKENDS